MAKIKQLIGFAVLNVNGGERVSYTYEVIDETGKPESDNCKESFYAVDEEIKDHIEAMKTIIKQRMEG